MNNIIIHVLIERPYKSLVNPQSITQAAQQALDWQGVVGRQEMTILVGDDQQIQQLQQQFLGLNSTTDVLAFPSGEVDPETGIRYLGDVAISYSQGLRQAEERSHGVEEEIQLLVVHGVLHLLGFDHQDPLERRRMWAAQREILSRLGCQVDLDI